MGAGKLGCGGPDRPAPPVLRTLPCWCHRAQRGCLACGRNLGTVPGLTGSSPPRDPPRTLVWPGLAWPRGRRLRQGGCRQAPGRPRRGLVNSTHPTSPQRGFTDRPLEQSHRVCPLVSARTLGVPRVSPHFFLRVGGLPVAGGHHVFIRFSADRRWGCSHLLVVGQNAPVNTGVWVFWLQTQRWLAGQIVLPRVAL